MTDLLLIHGLGCNGSIWDRLREHLPDSFQATAPDLPGGRSMEAEAADLIPAVRDGSPLVIGHSMGGLVATALVERAPEQIAASFWSARRLRWRAGSPRTVAQKRGSVSRSSARCCGDG